IERMPKQHETTVTTLDRLKLTATLVDPVLSAASDEDEGVMLADDGRWV
ncbi:MAG: hypothetical protein QG608_3142, partial [Actinomycetota bacterium]|nr:hypothetical protein [Actinomycetota bacterium]